MDLVVILNVNPNENTDKKIINNREYTRRELKTILAKGFSEFIKNIIFYDNFEKFKENVHQHLDDFVLNFDFGYNSKIRNMNVPAFCENYNIKYFNPDPYVQVICQDKFMTEKFAENFEIKTPQSLLVFLHSYNKELLSNFNYPVIIKPNYESSSIGIDENNIGYYDSHFFNKVKEMSSCYRQEILLEEFIEGFEAETPVISCKDSLGFFPVGINLDFEPYMGDRILNYNNRSIDNYTFFDFSEKFPELSHELLKTAYKVIKLLSIIGFGRVDFRIKSNKMFYITDISTNPHYTLKSSYHFIFEQLGLDYKYLIACLM